jgi:hypothetical protein
MARMEPSLDECLSEEMTMRILHALSVTGAEQRISDLAELTRLDLASLASNIARLIRGGLVVTSSLGGVVLHALSPRIASSRVLAAAVENRTRDLLRARARLFSERCPAAVGWIDETLAAIRRARAVSRFPRP